MRKSKTIQPSQDLNFEAFSWCVKNDFQVYIQQIVDKKSTDKGDFYVPTGKFKIAVRRGGISSEGKDEIYLNGRKIKSKVTLSEMTFRSQADAERHLNHTYELLMRKYG